MVLNMLSSKIEPQHLSVLRQVALFADLTRHELQTLNDLLHIRHYIAKEIIFDQAEEGQAIYFVLSGLVHVKTKDHPQVLAELTSGDFFGERALITDAPRTAQIRAAEDTLVAVLFRNDFFNLLSTHPSIGRKIYMDYGATQVPVTPNNLTDLAETSPESESLLMYLTASHIGSLTWLGIIATTSVLLMMFKSLLWLVLPFLFGLILYYCLVPIAKKLVRRGFSRSFSAVALSGALLLLIGGVISWFYSMALANSTTWQSSFNHYLSGGANLAYQLLHSLQDHSSLLQNAQIGEEIYLKIDDVAKNFSDKYLGEIISSFAKWLPSLMLAPLISFFLLKDGAHIRKMLGAAVPNAFFEKTLYLIHAVDHTAKLYLMGLIKVAIVDSLFLTFGLWWCGFSFFTSLFVSVMCAILNWVPYLGPLLGCGLVLMIAATDLPANMTMIYSIIAVFLALRLLDDFVTLPMVLGKSLRIHPFITIMMFVIGEAIAGITGLMLVIPILAVVIVLGETLEIIISDKRLRARQQYTQKLSWEIANRGLEDQNLK